MKSLKLSHLIVFLVGFFIGSSFYFLAKGDSENEKIYMIKRNDNKVTIVSNGSELAEIFLSNNESYSINVKSGKKTIMSANLSIQDKLIQSVLFETQRDPVTKRKFWYQWIDPRFSGSEDIKGMRKLDSD